MKIDQFLIDVDEVIKELQNNKEAFGENMKHMGLRDKSFCSWLMTYLAWSEVGDERDCNNYWELKL